MPEVVLLGTGAALSDGARTTTMLAVCHDGGTFVVDCGGDVVQRLLAAGIDLDSIDGLIITHEHADHTSGFPLFMEKIWLSGRNRPMPVYGPEAGLSQARRCFETFDTGGWDGLPELQWNVVPLDERTPFLQNDRWQIFASPADHGVPCIGVRFEFPDDRCMAYSSDTRPCESISRLAEDCDVLIHEASGAEGKHTTVAQAASIAKEAAVSQLILVHLPPHPDEGDLAEAMHIFNEILYGSDLEVVEI